MSLKRQLFKGVLTLGVGQAAGYILSFIRNVVVARLLTQADFGISATFALTISLLDMASDMAVDRFLIQSKEGDQVRLQGVVHAFEAARGVVLALMLFAFAVPFARIFGVPEAAWAYQLLALTPIIRGFRHLDVARVQRNLRYAPQVIMEAATSAVALAAVWPLAVWLRDYSVVLWIVLFREAMMTAMSHLMAERPYRWAWEKQHIRMVLAFGWPLLFNGLLMYAAVQGDRLIVGAAYSMEQLGLYAAAVFLAMTPVMPLSRLHGALVLPVLSRVQDDTPVFLRRYNVSAQLMGFAGAGLMILFVLLGEEMMRGIYGAKYAGGGALLAWIGAAQCIRLVRIAANTTAMSLGDTKNPMYSNIARASGVLAAVLIAFAGAPLWGVAAAGFAGEVAAIFAAAIRLRKQQSMPAQAIAVPAAWVLCSGALAWAAAACVSGSARYVAAFILLAGLGCMALAVSPVLRESAAWVIRTRWVAFPSTRTDA